LVLLGPELTVCAVLRLSRADEVEPLKSQEFEASGALFSADGDFGALCPQSLSFCIEVTAIAAHFSFETALSS
jgi:hypothetical protein